MQLPPPAPSSSPPTLPTKLLHTLTTHTAPINALTFSSHGGTYILTGSSDRQIHLSRTLPPPSAHTSDTTASPIQKYSAHGYAILAITCASDNQSFASCGGDRVVFIWDVQSTTPTRRLGGGGCARGHTSRINSIMYAGDGESVLASGGDDRSVRLWDLRSRDANPLMVWEEARDGVSCLAVGGGGVEVVCGSVDGRVRSYDVRMGRVVVDTFPGPVTCVELMRDGGGMLVGTLDSRLRIMDRRDGMCLRVFPDEDEVGREGGYKNAELRIKSCFGGNEAMVMSGSESDGRVRAWDVLTGKEVGSVEVGERGKVVSCVMWREGGKGKDGVWAAGGAEGVVRVYGYGHSKD